MMTAIDTGVCVPESRETLALQQRQLVLGKRNSQMFPVGTIELSLPDECDRYENSRGVYHFRNISVEKIKELSEQGRENEILLLGPFSKFDIALRLRQGEILTYITEYISSIELRCAIGTNETIDEQRQYFEQTKESDGVIVIGECPSRVRWRLVANDMQKSQKVMSHGR
jgi:hypothetical protein